MVLRTHSYPRLLTSLALLVSSSLTVHSAEGELKEEISAGYTVTTIGTVFFVAGSALEYSAIPIAIGGEPGHAQAAAMTGSVLQITGPIMASAGATVVESGAKKLGQSYYSANNWSYYRTGLIFQLASIVSNLIPLHFVVDERVRYENGVATVSTVTISPIPMVLSLISQAMYVANSVHAYSYISSMKRQSYVARPEVRLYPSLSYSDGRYAGALNANF